MRKWIFVFLLCGSLFAADDEVIICENGTEMLAWNYAFLEQAEQSIELSSCFMGGDVCKGLLSAFERKLQEKPQLQIHILTTPILMDQEDEAAIERMLTLYPDRFHLVHAFNVMTMEPTGSIDNHMKLMVVDEKYYSMGGSNYDDIAISEGTVGIEEKPHFKNVPVVLPSGSRDQDLVGRGEKAAQLRTIFFQMYAIWERFNKEARLSDLNPYNYETRWFPVDADPYVEVFEDAEKIPLNREDYQIIMGGPFQKRNLIKAEYERLIAAASKNIWIANLYYNPPKEIYKLIKGALVPCTIITNGPRENAPKCNQMYAWAHRVNYVPTFYGRSYRFWERKKCEGDPLKPVHIFEYDVKNVVLHKKVMVVDDEIAVVGSYNLGAKSDGNDYELVAVMRSKRVAAELKKIMKRDIQFSAPIKVEEARRWYFDPHTAYLGELQKNFNGFV